MSCTCCCSTCDARMIELIQSIDDLRRSLVIAIQEVHVSSPVRNQADPHNDRWYWDH